MPELALSTRDTTPPWISSFEHREHPPGEAGVFSSLEEVRKHVNRGKIHPDVSSWVGHTLLEAGDPKGHIARAEALFNALKKQYVWVPDPRGVERMAGAHLTLGDGKKKPLLPGGDCDDGVIAYLAACECAGIPTCIVGAAYDDGANISHVLGMVSDGKGSWYYADPSADWGFGQAKPTTREYIIDTLDGRVVCDGKSCTMSGRRPSPEGPGHFLSLNEGPHEPQVNTLGMVPIHAPGFLGAPDELAQETKDLLADMVQTMLRNWNASMAVFNACNDALASLGLPALGAPGLPGFGPSDYQRMVDLKAITAFGMDMLEQAIDGRRSVALMQGVAGWDMAIERLPTDTVYLGWDGAKQRPQLYAIQGDQPIKSGGTLGGFPVVGAIVAGVVIWLGGCAASAAESWSKAEQAKAAAAQKTAEKEAELIKAGKTDELVKVYDARKGIVQAEQQNGPGAQVAQVLDSATRFLSLVGKAALILGAGWAAKKGYDYYKGRR